MQLRKFSTRATACAAGLAASADTTATATRVPLHASADLAVVKLDRDVTNTPTKIASTYPPDGLQRLHLRVGRHLQGQREHLPACRSPALKTATMRVTGRTTDAYGGTAIGR
ncbi:hypothetical protein ABZ791_02275 [Streptomyces huasconensis]|uniref:Uncharacterized protein n=1 Tax=Streptomyces huasconensis TaxID=1854574 RepID=A0ABV3LRJ1_9ACTN